MLYIRTEHIQGFSIYFIIKNPLNSPRITFNFKNKLSFQNEQKCRKYALYSYKARYNKLIRIPVRVVQIIWLAVQVYSCQKCQTIKVQKPSKFTFCNSLQTKIVRQVEFNIFVWSFKSLIQNLTVKCWVNFGRIMAHENTRVFSHDKVENKLFKASVFWMNDSRIHRNMKIARDTAKLGCSDFPLNASERISEQALIFSLEGRLMESEANLPF